MREYDSAVRVRDFGQVASQRRILKLYADFRRRVLAMGDRLSGMDGDTLVVSHAGMMMYLSQELRRRGFAGPKLRIPRHAIAYIYERPDAKPLQGR